MKKYQRILSLLLACVLALALLPDQALAAVVGGAYTVLTETTIDADPNIPTEMDEKSMKGLDRYLPVYFAVYSSVYRPTSSGDRAHVDTASLSEYIYNEVDPGANMVLPVEQLERVTDLATAVSAVQALTNSMSSVQKVSPTGIDLATLYTETAVARAARKAVNSNEIIINAAAVAELERIALQTSQAVESALVNGGVSTARYLANTVTLTTNATGEISIKVDPDVLTTQVDKIRVETSTYALTLDVADLKDDLTQILTFTTEDVGTAFAPSGSSGKPSVRANMPPLTNPATISIRPDDGTTTYQTVVNTSGAAAPSKYNPATTRIDGKVRDSGTYTVQTNQKDFTDISNKSIEMQTAIRCLASKGIINGTSPTTFSPDGSISRAEIAALLVRALGWSNSAAVAGFSDVSRNQWYYSVAASSQQKGLINGFEDNTFRGGTNIDKQQILVVAGRVLVKRMGYKVPSNPSAYLSRYKDSVVNWAQSEVALATKENLVLYRWDGTFKGTNSMTRGDAAIIIYRLFQKIW